MKEAEKYCRECEFFRYPEPSSFYPEVMVTYWCPHACCQWTGALGYTTGGMKACRHFKLKTQLTLF